MMPCDTRRSDMPCGDVNNGHVVDTRDHQQPRLVTSERNKTIPTSSFTCPKELEKQVWQRKKKQPLPSSRLLPCPCLFPTHLVHDRPTGNENSSLLSPLLAIRINATNNRRGAPLNICIPSLITSPPVCTPAGGQPSTADHPLGVQPWRLPALDTAAESKTRGSLVWSRRWPSMMTAARRRWNQCLP